MENKPVRVLIVDDHPIFRAGMRMVLKDEPEVEIVGEGTNGQEALRKAAELQPDVLVLDVNLPDMNGLEVTKRLHASGASAKVLILTVHNDSQMIFSLLEAGASGYVLKDDTLEMLVPAIQAVAHGETWLSSRIAKQVIRRALGEADAPPDSMPDLTPRELDVLQLLAQGLDNEAIARRLTLTMRTVQNHVSNLYGKLGVDSRAEAILFAIRRGLVDITREKNASDDR